MTGAVITPPPSTGGGSGTVTTVSVTTANGVSGTVATDSTTPAITLTLGAITPSSVVSAGAVSGSNLSGTNTGDQSTVSGNAGTATKLATARNINGVAFDGSAAINISVPMQPTKYTSGRYYSMPINANASTKAVAANTMAYWPIDVSVSQAFTAIGYDCTANTNSANAHFGVYTDTNSLPGTLVAGTDVTVATVGVAIADATFSGAVTLTPGRYWIAVLSSANSLTFTASSSANMLSAIVGTSTFQASGTGEGVMITGSQAYGALPNTAPTVVYTEASGAPLLKLKAQ